jgi:hypothetical protein
MTTNEALLPILPEAAAAVEQPEAIYALLEERIRRFTMGDSTSVPVETARRLLEGILYCLDLNIRFPSVEVPATAPLKDRWQAGVSAAKRISQRAKLLYLQVQRTPPPLVNTAYCDTMEALPAFFAAYDADFFAQEIPCSFDYPLCQPVSDSLLGAEYIKDFLRRLLAENSFMRALPREAMLALYERYYVDYADLLVNLYLPAAEMVSLCALAGEPVFALSLPQEKLVSVSRLLTLSGEQEARKRMLDAVERALLALSLRGDFLVHYTMQTAEDLLVRLRAASRAKETDKEGS